MRRGAATVRSVRMPDPTPFVAPLPGHAEVRRALDALLAAHVPAGAISVLTAQPGEARQLSRETGVDGNAEAAADNDRLADLIGWIAGIGASVIPAVGPDVAVGTAGATYDAARAGKGVGHGSITGVLVGFGVPVDDAAHYEAAVAQGNILVVVHDPTRYPEAQRILARD